MSATEVILSALLALTSYLIFRYVVNSHPPYPPGPRPKLIIGNALDIPMRRPWIHYSRMSTQFNSSIIHLSAFGTHVIVLHTLEDAVELLDRRSGNYSSRPANPVIKLIGFQDIVLALPYGNLWRKQRKLLERGLKKDAMPPYYRIQAEKVHLLLEQLLHDPVNFNENCKMMGIGITMAMGFGYDIIPGEKDEFVEPADFAINNGAELMLPGRTLIVVFGFLRHIPPWFPGASTQKLGARIREAAIQYKNEPYRTLKRHMITGSAKDCVLKQVLEVNMKEDGSVKDEDVIKNAMAALYLGGVETMQITQVVFIKAMALFPEVQKKAQEEIDKVVGPGRLPNHEDRASLPYVEALYREALRWRPAGPLGFGHATLEDDVYKGYFIPKGSIVMPNVWAITRDERAYPEPESFRPERFFNPDGTLNNDKIVYAFGFGRRICPGRHMADTTLWLTVASILATFNISKARDEGGNEIEIDANACTDSFACHPLPFKCSVVPRSEQAASLIRSVANIARQNLRK